MTTPGRSFPPLADEAAVLALVEGFRRHTLPVADWTHQAHLCVGLWHVRSFGEEAARTLLRDGISRYNTSVGVPNSETRGYHETVTMYYVWAAARFLDAVPASPLLDQINGFVASTLGSKAHIFTFWSRDRLLSVEARLGWVEPDLRALAVE